jgi:hypothetical protein
MSKNNNNASFIREFTPPPILERQDLFPCEPFEPMEELLSPDAHEIPLEPMNEQINVKMN